jgi:hypothetical protein
VKVKQPFLVAAWLAAAAPLAAQQHRPPQPSPSRADSDSAFAAMQERGMHVMGVNQYTARHVFEPLPDGGRIELQETVDDTAAVTRIRHHLAQIATAFSRGDFTAPGLVHRKHVPGTEVMAARRAAITYRMTPLPRGGEVRITSRDPDAVAAVHAFLAFQRREHHAGAH